MTGKTQSLLFAYSIMSQTQSRKQTEIFQRKPYLQIYFSQGNASPSPDWKLTPVRQNKDIMRHNPKDSQDKLGFMRHNPQESKDKLGVMRHNPKDSQGPEDVMRHNPEDTKDKLGVMRHNPKGDSDTSTVMNLHSGNSLGSSDNMGHDSDESEKSSRGVRSNSLPTTARSHHYVSYRGKPLASSYDPTKQAIRLFESNPFRERDLIIILGLGNPEILRIIGEKLTEHQIAIAIDSSEEMIPLLWNDYMEDFLELPGRHAFCGDRFISLLWNYLDGLSIERMSGVKFYTNSGNLSLQPDFYRSLEERIGSIFSSKMSDLLTKFEFETLWISNIIRNTIRYTTKNQFSKMNSFRISELKNALTSIPAILVSAGPSLRSQIPLITRVRDRVFLLSCDTSLKVLLKSGIIPDGVYTLDAQMNSLFHFLGEDTSNIPIFADLVTAPYLLDCLVKSNVVFSTTAKYINEATGNLRREVTAGGEFADEWMGEIGDIQSGGSVATTAFDALRYMGCQNVFFVGQDLAYTGREIHSTGTHHNEKWLGLLNRRLSLEKINEAVVRKRDTRYVESIDGSTVLTDYVLDLYRSWFEEAGSSLTDMRMVNVGSKGAKIKGIENISTQQGEARIMNFQPHSYPWKKLQPWMGREEAPNGEKCVTDGQNHDTSVRNRWEKEHRIADQHSHPLQKVWDDLEACTRLIPEWSKSGTWARDTEDWFAERAYLKRIYRKTEIYVGRHRNAIDEPRKRKLVMESIQKEISRLKRKIYPMLGVNFL